MSYLSLTVVVTSTSTMAQTGFFHHIGTFLLLAATVLLIVTCISAPVVHNIALLNVDLGARNSEDHRNVAFGTFGYCVTDPNLPYVASSSDLML